MFYFPRTGHTPILLKRIPFLRYQNSYV